MLLASPFPLHLNQISRFSSLLYAHPFQKSSPRCLKTLARSRPSLTTSPSVTWSPSLRTTALSRLSEDTSGAVALRGGVFPTAVAKAARYARVRGGCRLAFVSATVQSLLHGCWLSPLGPGKSGSGLIASRQGLPTAWASLPSAPHRRLALRHASLRPGEPLPRRPRPAPPFSKLGRGAGIPSSGRDSYVELHPRRVTKLNAFSVCAHHVFRLVRETHTPPFRENPAQSSYDSWSISRFSLMCTYFCILFRCFFPFF